MATKNSVPRYSLYKTKNETDEFVKIKHRGKIYTPDYLVKVILDRGGYCGSGILQKHVIDNSCGDGQFMIYVVDEYCKEYLRRSKSASGLKRDLELYIHAIDIDESELEICRRRCDEVASTYGIDGVDWDFINGNAMTINKYDGRMDFVVGNPPYVRIHNLGEDTALIKSCTFCKNGMTDLYILFYEIGIQMLNKTGVLAYITPSSFFTSLAGREMRSYLIENNLLTSVCDLKHFQAFNATTYTAIIVLRRNNHKDSVKYAEFDAESLSAVEVSTLSRDDYVIDGKFYFSDKNSLAFLRDVLECDSTHDFSIKNGYATLADKIFINDFNFKSKFIIPVIKASCARWTTALYPYDKNGALYSESELFEDENVKKYLLEKKSVLVNRSNEKDSVKYWYAFGRSQAIGDTYRNKLALNTLLKTKNDIKLIEAGSGTGVYSGLYIVSDTIPLRKLKNAIASDDFCEYVAMLGKYRRGGYYTYSSKDVTRFLNYKLSKEKF